MEKAVRSQLLGSLVLLIIGALLLVTVTISQPNKVVHEGYVTLNTPQELAQFSNAIILNNISSGEYEVYGSELPLTVHLNKLATDPDSTFNYGAARSASLWRMDMGAMGVGTLIWWAVGIIFCVLGMIYLILPILLPKTPTHRLIFGGRFVPDGFDTKKFNERIDAAYEETEKEIEPRP